MIGPDCEKENTENEKEKKKNPLLSDELDWTDEQLDKLRRGQNMRTKTFEVREIRWDVTTNQSGTKKAVPTCPEHPTQEAIVEGSTPFGVLVWCPKCRSKLEFCSKEEFETQKQNAEAS